MPIQDEVKKSRITLIHNTTVNGEVQSEEIPFRILVTGDLSDGSSKDRQLKLNEREIRNFDGNNTNSIIKDMGININLEVINKINPEEEETVKVELPIENLKSFSPEQIAQKIPKVRKLLELKALLKEGLTAIGNNRKLAAEIKKLYQDKESYGALKKQLEPIGPLLALSKSSSESETTIVTVES